MAMSNKAREAYNAYMNDYRHKNPEKIREINKRYRDNHPDRIKRSRENYWERKASENAHDAA